MHHRLLALAVSSAIVAAPGRARADARECIAQSERAQQARTDGHLLAARDAFHACSNAECPPAIRTDCEKSFDEVDRAIPSLVLIVRRGGEDLTDVRVLVDGAVVATKLDGRAISVDPGPHRVRVESGGGARLDERDIVAHAPRRPDLALSRADRAEARGPRAARRARPRRRDRALRALSTQKQNAARSEERTASCSRKEKRITPPRPSSPCPRPC